MQRPTSHWNDSRAWQPEFRIHVSQPYRRVGMTHVSKILAEDSGFNSSWNAPRLPREKKAFLALFMLSATECLAKRSCCHHTPRHLPELDICTQELLICKTQVHGIESIF